MANPDRPNGFTPVRHLSGGVIRTNKYQIATDTASAIFTGDCVTLTADGVITVAAADSTSILGVFAGCEFTNEAGEQVFSKHWPAAQATKGDANGIAYVYDDPNIIYKAQTVSGTAATENMIGAWWDLTATAGSTTTGRSAMEVNVGASAQDTFRILALVEEPDNSWAEHAKVEVIINDYNLAKNAGAAI